MRFTEILKSKLAMSILIFIVVSLIVVIAGDVIVKEGNVDVGKNLNVTGNLTTSGITLNQGADSKGFDIYGYDDQSSEYFKFYVDSSGDGTGIASGDFTFGSIAGTLLLYTNALGVDVQLGDLSGLREFRVLDSGSNEKASIDSDGNAEFHDGHIYRNDNAKSYFGTGNDAYITWDGTNLVFKTNETSPNTGNAWFSRNVSATGYITRTSVYDKSRGSALGFIQDADYYRTAGEIDHSKFYGYTTYEVTDFSRPEIEYYSCLDAGEEATCNRTIYPYTKTEEAISLNAEIDVLRQAVYELTQRLGEVCTKDNSYSWC